MIGAVLRRLGICGLFGIGLTACQQPQTSSPQACPSIEYAGPAEAMQALLADPNTKRSIQSGWYLIERRRGKLTEYWTFTPTDHPAHPSVGMRVGCQHEDGSWGVKTNLICQANKRVCDALLEDYLLLDEQLRQHLEETYGSGI